MKKYFSLHYASQTKTNTAKTDMTKAADDVHRIALRNPSLYQKRSVPSVMRPAFSNFFSGRSTT